MSLRAESWTVIASSERGVRDLAPFVAAIDARGRVAFRARADDGRAGVFVGDGERLELALAGDAQSHPIFLADGAPCAFVERGSGRALSVARGGGLEALVEPGALLRELGPLGPTAREDEIAFRAELRNGAAAVLLARGGRVELVAEARGEILGFQGLPLALGEGAVVYRAELRRGGAAIRRWMRGGSETLVDTRAGFVELARFPFAAPDGSVLFCATQRDGAPGVFRWREGRVERALDTGDAFESFRSALCDARGRVLFTATPRGGALGLFSGPHPEADRSLAIGDPLLGSTLEDFALNPVSIEPGGRIALRVELADGREAILRGEPMD